MSFIWRIMLEKILHRCMSGLKILFPFLYLPSYALLRKTFCVIITESRGKTQLVCKLGGHVLRQENLA